MHLCLILEGDCLWWNLIRPCHLGQFSGILGQSKLPALATRLLRELTHRRKTSWARLILIDTKFFIKLFVARNFHWSAGFGPANFMSGWVKLIFWKVQQTCVFLSNTSLCSNIFRTWAKFNDVQTLTLSLIELSILLSSKGYLP